MKRSRYGLVMALVSFATFTQVTGCALQGPHPVTIYTVEPGWSHSDPVATEKSGSAIIQMAPVRGAEAFASTDILYSDRRYRQQSYAYSRWRDVPVRSMQTVLEVAMGKSGHFRDVLPPTSVSRADLLLESTLLEFGHVIADDGSSAGVVRMRFHLVDNKNKMMAAGKELVARMPAATADAGGAAAAINQAAQRVAADLVGWLESVAK